MLNRAKNMRKTDIIPVAKQAVMRSCLGLFVFVGGCMTATSAAQLGRSEHPKVVAASGGLYKNTAVTGYVTQVGSKVAAQVDDGTGPFTFTTLDTPTVNAFALPGGYTYVTRGLLALVNDEAELAGVLGHEITHITEAHTAERYNRSQAAGLGALLVGIATGSEGLMNVAGYGSQLFLLKYSRGQEFESDRLGIELMHRAGYDAYAMGDFLGAMGAQSGLNAKIAGKAYDPGKVDYFSTHPNTARRVAEARDLAQQLGAVPGKGVRARGTYLDHIDGLLYGDSPGQGFVRGNRFSHPVMRFEFTAPPEFTLQNTPAALVGGEPGGASFKFDAATDYRTGGTLADYITRIWAPKLKITAGPVHRSRANGIVMASARTQVQSKSGLLEVRLVAIQQAPDKVFRFMILVPAARAGALSPALDGMLASYHRLSAGEAAALKPLWVRVITVQRGDTVSGLSKRMAFEDHREERFRALNNLKTGAVLRAGQKVKIVTR